MGSKSKYDERLPPELDGLPILGNAISFAKSPIKFIQKTTAELGQIWRTEIVGQEQAFLVGNEALNSMLNEENVSRADPIPYMVQILAGGEKRITPFLDGQEHIDRRNLLRNLITPAAANSYLPVLEEIVTTNYQRLATLDQFSAFQEFARMQAQFIARIVGGLPKEYINKHTDDMVRILKALNDGLESKIPVNIPFTAFGNALKQENIWIGMIEESLREREKLYASVKDINKMPQDFVTHLVVSNHALPVHKQLAVPLMARELHHLTIANYGITSLLTYLVLALTSNASVKKKVKQEIVDVLGENPGELTVENIDKLEYLNQVVKETLRFYPIVPILSGKAKKDFEVEDFTIKKGWVVMGSIFTTNRDPEVYTRPNTFDPDRFSKERAEDQAAPFPLTAFVPQGGGDPVNGHRCLGESFSRWIAKYYIIRLLTRYDWSLIAEQNVEIDFDKFAPVPFDGVLIKFEHLH
eukprot:TRINITY_DN2590_c0_g1_i1.p1 TRINITY_DN2590_c0_g1~~TRINITY_DN2590_c0_g1_i1.p1  ORF type:complete len:469 (+),score=91.10 TRINITY_DN2590_c0_g1_i1:185-1591(+)